MKTDEQIMLDLLPQKPYSIPGSGYFKIPAANCFVCKDKDGNIGIYPIEGGWLAANIKDFEADIAPFHG